MLPIKEKNIYEVVVTAYYQEVQIFGYGPDYTGLLLSRTIKSDEELADFLGLLQQQDISISCNIDSIKWKLFYNQIPYGECGKVIAQKTYVDYFTAMQRCMTEIGKDKNTIFIGQAVGVGGTFMSNTLKGVDSSQKLEAPVCESLQMQMTLGLALSGYRVISIYPRQNFLLLATADMTNMLDKLAEISSNKLSPNIIIRTSSGPHTIVDPQCQHKGNYIDSFQRMFDTIQCQEIRHGSQAQRAYNRALAGGIHLITEVGEMYEH